VFDAAALQWLLLVLTSWLERREREILAYLIVENRLLRRQLGTRRVRLTDADRRRLAVRAIRVGRRTLDEIASIATPDTLLRWHRQLVARKWTSRICRGRRVILAEIERLVVRMADENPTWGYTRIQGALQNVGHRVGRSTIARILKAHGLPPVPQRPTSWQTFLRAHWGAIAGADFFTTEVWTWRGLVTYYTVFVIDLASRRVVLAGSTPWPNEMFMRQVVRSLTTEDGFLVHPDRRTPFPSGTRRVRRPLPWRAQSPRAGQRLDCWPTDDEHPRSDSATAATGWTTQLLRARSVMGSHTSTRQLERVMGHYGSRLKQASERLAGRFTTAGGARRVLH
jgi:hypothetical protein